MPVLMEPGFIASGWLGIITAGALWVPLFEKRAFDGGIKQLVQQIQRAVPREEQGEDDDDELGGGAGPELFTADEVRSELERLRADMEAASSRRSKPVGRRSAADGQPAGPCELPAGVPQLPSGLRVSSEMRSLGEALLHGGCRVGFNGMGGVGKTTVSSWLVRRDDVRERFEAIAWLPLGQNPNIPKCQELLHLQLTGLELAPELGQDERQEMLRYAMSGVRLLLVLDDLWCAASQCCIAASPLVGVALAGFAAPS